MDNTENIIMKNDNTPFADERSAAIQKSKLSKEGMDVEVIGVDGGGFALRVKPERKRVPLNTRNLISFNKINGYKLYLVNDKEDRIERFFRAGWEAVKSDERLGNNYAGSASPIGSTVTKKVGNGVTGVLLRKRQDWYDEDYEKKIKRNDAQTKSSLQAAMQDRYGSVTVGKDKFNGDLIPR